MKIGKVYQKRKSSFYTNQKYLYIKIDIRQRRTRTDKDRRDEMVSCFERSNVGFLFSVKMQNKEPLVTT